MMKGEIVRGHYCADCLPFVEPAQCSPSNPRKTELCVCCGHCAEGLDSVGQRGDWLILGRLRAALADEGKGETK